MNRVIDRFNAEIDGKRAALSGCDTTECERRAGCLRADATLACRVRYRPEACRYLIPIEEAA
jgi:hypothetical protein